jgi:hypothetical protein
MASNTFMWRIRRMNDKRKLKEQREKYKEKNLLR